MLKVPCGRVKVRLMQWWTDFLNWLNSDSGWRIVSTVVIPFVAIVVAGIAAAGIGRASARKVIELSEREVRASAVTALISAARKAAVWNTLPAPEQQHIDHLIGDAEIRLRLLPIAGTALAADWARHEIAGMKRNAISFSFQAEQSLLVFRDRLIEWQGRPSRAKKLFKNDLDSWAYDSSASEQELVHQQQKWAAEQVSETGPAGAEAATAATPVTAAAATPTPVTASPFTRPPSPAPIAAPIVESTAASAAAATAAVAASAAPGQSASGPSDTVGRADEEPPPLVEPSDTPPHGASDASIVADRGARGSADDDSNSDSGEPTRDGHVDGENPGETRDGNRTDDSSAGGPAGSTDGSENHGSESHVSENQVSENHGGDHGHETHENGDGHGGDHGHGDNQHGEHQEHDDQEHDDHEHRDPEHRDPEHHGHEHDHHDHNHEEWRG